jgi:hypothetical protein
MLDILMDEIFVQFGGLVFQQTIYYNFSYRRTDKTMSKRKRTNNELQNFTYKTKDRVTWNHLKSGVKILDPSKVTGPDEIQCSLVKPPPSVQSVVWRYNEFGDKLRDIENRKLSDHMKRWTFNSTDMQFPLVQIHKYK